MSRPPIPFYIVRGLLKPLFHTVLDIKVEGKENIPEKGPYILISNHLNWSDPFYYYTILPASPKVHFVAEFFGSYDNKYKKAFIDFMGKPIVPFDRENPRDRVKATKKMIEILNEGNVLGIFPEGRMAHQENDPFPFHVGTFSVAKKLGVPVLPCAIAGTHQLALRKPIHFSIGELAYCGGTESDEDFARRMALKIRKLIPAYPGDGPFPHKWNWMTTLCQGELRPFTGERDLILPQRRDRHNA